MTEKKVKIDLKTRLGRTSATKAPPAGSIPAPGAAPLPPVPPPPPGIMQPSGIPAPPFVPSVAPKPVVPKISNEDPFAAISAADAPRQAPQDYKIEIGHDVVQAQSKSTVKVIIAALVAAVVAGGIGVAVGGMRSDAKRNESAVKSARDVASSIEKSKTNIEKLASEVDAASKTMYKDKKFPADFSKKLADITIEFNSGELAGKNIDRLRPSTVKSLFDFARDAQELDAKRDWLRRVFEGKKAAIEDILTGAQTPKVRYIAFIQKNEIGAVGTFASIKDPFGFKDKTWPEKVTIITPAETVEAERYKSGEPFVKPPKKEGEKPTVYAVPLEPDGIVTAFPDPLGSRLSEELKDMVTLVRGSPPGTAPSEEKSGLIVLADNLVQDLRAVGGAK